MKDLALREEPLGGSPSGARGPTQAARLALVNAIVLAGSVQAQSTNVAPAAVGSTNAPARIPDTVVVGEREPPYNPATIASPKYTEPLRDIPQTITVVPQSLIEDQGATSLRDVLRNVTGISIQAGEGGVPAGDNLSIRGFNARTDLFIDGVRDLGGYARDPFNTEQVEVTKGPASSTSGRGSTGGSVNMVSKTPGLDASYGLSAGGGTDGYLRFTTDVNQPLGGSPIQGAALRLNGMFHDADTPGRDEATNRRWGIAPSLAVGLGTDTRFTLGYFHQSQDNMPDYGIPWVPANTNALLAAYSNQAPPVSFHNFYGITARDYEEVTTDIVTGVYEHEVREDYRLRNATRWGRNDRDSVITAPRFVNANISTAINRQLQSRDMVDTILANQTDFRAEFATGPIDHALITGLEFAREDSENFARTQIPLTATPLTDLFQPTPGDPFNGTIVRTGAVTDSRADSVAVYAFDTLTLHEQWEVSGGLRWERFDARVDSTTAGNVTTRNGRVDDMLSWRAGLVFKPQPNGSIYAGAGNSYNPSAEGLTLAANLVDVEPEESMSYEVGTKWDFFDERLSVSAALFRTEKTNARTPGVNAGDPPQVLDGEQIVQGVEFGVAGRLTRDWQVFGGYAYMQSEIEDSNNAVELGNALANTPEHTFSLWTTYRLPWDIELGFGAQYVGDRYNANTNVRAAPGYWTFDAMAAYDLTDNLSLRLNVYNLADERYIDRVGGGHFVPGPGRSAVLSANLKF